MLCHDYFVNWMDTLLQALENWGLTGCIIVMDNAKYHKALPESTPKQGSRRANMISAMKEYGLDIPDNAMTAILWKILSKHIEANVFPVSADKARPRDMASCSHRLTILTYNLSNLSGRIVKNASSMLSTTVKPITAFKIFICHREHSLGDSEAVIPKIIRENKHVINFPKTKNECVFHCIAWHTLQSPKKDPRRIEAKVNGAFKRYCSFKDVKYSLSLFRSFKPIDLLQLDEIDDCFKLGINVYKMDVASGNVECIRRSDKGMFKYIGDVSVKIHQFNVNKYRSLLQKIVYAHGLTGMEIPGVNLDKKYNMTDVMDWIKEGSYGSFFGFHSSLGFGKQRSDYGKLKQQLHQVPVLGFNSGRYDINMIKKDFFAVIGTDNIESVIKNPSYMCIATSNMKMLDISKYVPAGTSYDKYLTTYLGGCKYDDKIRCVCGLGKGLFPYEYITSFNVINPTALLPKSAFDSKLRGTSITDDDYERVKFVWWYYEMKFIKDLLIWYNNLDVFPFIKATNAQRELFKSFNLDTFADGVSLPGLSDKAICVQCNTARKGMSLGGFRYMKLLEFNSNRLVYSIDQEEKDIYAKMKTNIAGGPSIIVNLYAKRNETKIRGGKVCKKIIGYDANALYLWALDNEMPCGRLTIINAYPGVVDDIINEKIFGFRECDIRTPPHLKDYFSEMTPILKNILIGCADESVIGKHMFDYNE
ncbi:unnamed protein product [Phytophthora fragariaefolia]|uniref:Unnamed protein product n=1 Tax=Phytophthora fragariaefolia TaxID=1490495 RepID=A0A9W6TJR5_9STRA|nr:unnamed protein product [Phytophthora fragariaefolia]